jgi:thioesterase domain-containing protein
MTNEEMKAIAEMTIDGIPAIKRTGIRVLEIRPRYTKILMPLEGNVNHVGMMYAGSLFTIGEIPGGILHLASFDVNRFFPIVKEINIRFRRPATTDVTLEMALDADQADHIQAEAEEKGKADFSLEMEIKDADGQVVSIVNGTWQIRKIPAEMKK